MIIRRLYTAYALLALLDQADPLPQQLRLLLYDRNISQSAHLERRLAVWATELAGTDRVFWVALGGAVDPWATHGRAVAFDSTSLETGGGVWHKNHRE